ncbi:hypothetical protein BDM02DRAFT_3184993 [Thelephora ganbajun]|uniref:Uncharacterized protein n=1 Tax=Thelephora ganbajun TaxID=370292 RepID=A0ACB6ZNW8_THEGA|nr:hypothetical protein BDM02DRAFT_3184993 [Thelephora ganbajun]
MHSRKPQTSPPAGHGNGYEDDLSKTFRYMTVDSRAEGKSNPKFIGGFSSNYPQTSQKVSRPSPPPSLRPADGRVLPPRRQSSGRMVFPVPMHVVPPPPVLHDFTPFQMPTPNREGTGQSLTMKYAQQDLGPPVPPKDFPRKPSLPPTNLNTHLQGGPTVPDHKTYQIRPSSDTSLPRPLPASQPSTPAKPGLSPGSVFDTPSIDKRKRGSSEPPSPSDEKKDQSEVQCNGQTKAGKRCTRLVKIGPPLAIVHPDAEDVERFCFQHVKDVFSQSGFYLKRNEREEFVKFEDWIPSYLHTDTQAALRSEMTKAPSVADVPGYIYTFEIRGEPKLRALSGKESDRASIDESDPDHIHLKVGRAVNLTKRLDQWAKQCGTKQREHIIRGWWPGTVDDSGDFVTSSGLLKGKVVAGDKGAYCHRLERLIHLELGDLVLSRQYLDPAFPKVDTANVKKASVTTKQKCAECGSRTFSPKFDENIPDLRLLGETTHKEIFTFKKVEKGKLQGKEWESIVQPVIQKWGEYVNKYPQRQLGRMV